MQAKLAGNPKVALVAAVHALALDCLYGPVSGSCVGIRASRPSLSGSAEGIEDGMAGKQLAAATKAAIKGMPKQPEKLWAWLLDRDQKVLLAILAVCTAMSVDAVAKRGAAADTAHAAELGQALKLDMTEYWQADAGYFGRVSKALILDAVREGIGPGAADKIGGLKKEAMAQRAAAVLVGKGWLPAILR